MNILVGKRIKDVWIASDKKAIKFDLDGGHIIANTDGDCCSESWVESFDDPEVLMDAVVASVEDIELREDSGVHGEEVTRYYGCKITTNKGVCVIDYRNASNGYYGGNLWWPKEDPDSYNYFYGGVYEQNVSTEEWRRLDD